MEAVGRGVAYFDPGVELIGEVFLEDGGLVGLAKALAEGDALGVFQAAREDAGDEVAVRLGGVLRDAQIDRLVDAAIAIGDLDLEAAHRCSQSHAHEYHGCMPAQRRERLRECVNDSFEHWQVPLLEALVEQPSATREVEDVEHVMVRLDVEARALGMLVEHVLPGEEDVASHRIFSTPGCDETTPALLLVGHADTVFPRAMGFFGFRREGEAARGPGVLDMKSGVTSMFAALRALRTVDEAAFAALKLRIAIVSDEEIGSPSSQSLYTRIAPHTTQALVFEAGRVHDRIVTTRKGSGLFQLRALGRAAHAGNKHAAGANAIHALAAAVLRVEALTDYDAGLTVNVGTITGGTAKNTVPDTAEIGIDVRFTRGEDVTRFRDALEAIAASPFDGIDARWVNERALSVRMLMSGNVSRPPMEATAASQALRMAYETHAEAQGLGIGEAPLQGGGSDGNLLAQLGIPCIDGLGPFGEYFHERREWCSLTSLAQRTAALATFLADEALKTGTHAGVVV